MNRIAILVVLACLTGCASRGELEDQVSQHEPHAIIEIPSFSSPYRPELANGEEIVIEAFDGRDLPSGPHSIRVRPGFHDVSYRVVTPKPFSDLSPRQKTAEVAMLPVIFFIQDFDHRYVEFTQPTRQVELEAGKTYSYNYLKLRGSAEYEPSN